MSATRKIRNRDKTTEQRVRDRVKAMEWRETKGRRMRADGLSDSIQVHTPIEEPTMIERDPNEVLFGVYGLDDWATCTRIKQHIIDGVNTIVKEGTWILPSPWDLVDWVVNVAPSYNFMSAQRALLFYDWGHAEVTETCSKITIQINGDVLKVREFIAQMDARFKRAENLIEWIYGQHGESASVPLNYRPAIASAYPWLSKPMSEYIDDYLSSDASVLILLGPPGTGKTTFIKNLIHRSGANAKVTYDERIMSTDSLFANFIEGSEQFLIMEDADAFLKAREDGNTMMHRFLNVSDGLVSARGKKLVFSTNLPSVRDVDAALMRPGRCFDVVEFRAMTRDEAAVVAAELGRDLPDGPEFTLAELTNDQPSTMPTRHLGFI